MIKFNHEESIVLSECLEFTLNPIKSKLFAGTFRNKIPILIKCNNKKLNKQIALKFNPQKFIFNNQFIEPRNIFKRSPLIELPIIATEEQVQLKELKTIDVGSIVFFDSIKTLQNLYSNAFIEVGNTKLLIQIQGKNTAIILEKIEDVNCFF